MRKTWLVLALLCGCGGTDATSLASPGVDASVESAPIVCEPGRQASCACVGGGQGAQRCDDDGTRWGDCVCPDASVQDTGKDAQIDTQTQDTGVDSGVEVGVDTGVDSGKDATADSLSPTVCQGGRFVLLEGIEGDCKQFNGTGAVLDNQTGIVWKRTNYPMKTFAEATAKCESLGLRLPTLDEARGIAGDPRDMCAFPCSWETWASDWAPYDRRWVVFWSGPFQTMNPTTSYRRFFCVHNFK